MKVTYIGPYDEVEVAATGAVVRRGDSVDVPDEIAGRAPSEKRVKDEVVTDPGEGLLAQVDVWAVEAAAPKKKTEPAPSAADTTEEA